MIFCGGSSRRDGIRIGRSPTSRLCSAARAERLAERTEENVATASTSVPPAVASEEIVTQSSDTFQSVVAGDPGEAVTCGPGLVQIPTGALLAGYDWTCPRPYTHLIADPDDSAA